MPKRYYEILGVNENTSQKDIKKAYRKKAKKYHPDSNSEDADEEKFKKINEAYQVLSDEEKRKKYDRFGKSGISEEARRRARSDFSDFDDLFGSLFGGLFGGGSGRRRRGKSLRTKVTITLEEAYEGAKKSIRVRRKKKCEKCNGTGAKNGSLKTCPECNGSGKKRHVSRTLFGKQVSVATCDKCGGRGKIPEEKCEKCGGTGKVSEKETLEINVPRGVRHGQKLKLGGKGNYGGQGKPPGDLIVLIEIEDHDYFERKDENLFYNLEIGIPEASLGTEVEIPTIKGKVKMDIPAGTQTGKVFRLKDKGMPVLRKRYGGQDFGDLFVKAVVRTPEDLSDGEREILEELSEARDTEKNVSKGFFKTVKDNIEDVL